MDIIQGLIDTGNAGKSGWRIVNNGGAIGVLNNRTSNVSFSILNEGIGTSSNVSSTFINTYSGINVSNYTGSTSTSVGSLWSSNVSGSKIYYNSGNIGIGATDPIAPLHIYNTSNTRLLLDATTTGTASVEFRRGTGADALNDYRFINDTSNSSLKLQVENTTQSFGNTIADLAWFSSNDTIIHKNTTFNGRVGIGTVYHTTRSLDVLGDANVSGTVSVGGLSVSGSSNAVLTNSITSNTSFTIMNGFTPNPTSSSINLIRGTTADTNNDYKVGNFNGEFKVISSVSSVDTDYIRITTAGAITNPSGTANWNTGSDRRIKENIKRASYDKCLENINRLELNCFNYVSGFNTVNRDKTQLGFIAQEVSAIFPKSISTQEYYSDTLSIPDLLSIDISQINYALYGAVKKLIEINDEKDSCFKAMDEELKELELTLNITPEAVASSSNLVLEETVATTSNVLVEPLVLQDATSNLLLEPLVLQDATSNLLLEPLVLQEATSNLLLEPLVLQETVATTSNVLVEPLVLEETTSNLILEPLVSQDTTSNLILEPLVSQDTTSNLLVEPLVSQDTTSNLILEPLVSQDTTSNLLVEPLVLQDATSNLLVEPLVLQETVATTSNLLVDAF